MSVKITKVGDKHLAEFTSMFVKEAGEHNEEQRRLRELNISVDSPTDVEYEIQYGRFCCYLEDICSMQKTQHSFFEENGIEATSILLYSKVIETVEYSLDDFQALLQNVLNGNLEDIIN